MQVNREFSVRQDEVRAEGEKYGPSVVSAALVKPRPGIVGKCESFLRKFNQFGFALIRNDHISPRSCFSASSLSLAVRYSSSEMNEPSAFAGEVYNRIATGARQGVFNADVLITSQI